MMLTALAPGKVNLCLLLGGSRSDGKHELATMIESVSLADELTLTTRDGGGGDEVSCPGVEGPNLVARVLSELRDHGWPAPPVRIEVSKRIPVAGGMGGGSADAAAAIRLADELHPISGELIADLASRLGADVPSQLRPGLAVGMGAGDEVRLREPLPTHALLVLPLPHQLATGDVYAEADRLGLPRSSRELERASAELLRELDSRTELPPRLLVNDLQPAAISLCPPIADALDAAREAGAERAMVSGSGPTVFGLFWGAGAVERAGRAAGSLRERFPSASSAFPVGPEFGRPLVAAQSPKQS